MQAVQEEHSDYNRSLLLGDYASSINTIPKKRKGSKKGPSINVGHDPNASSGKKMSVNVNKKLIGSDYKSVVSKHDKSSEYQKRSINKKTLVMENIT